MSITHLLPFPKVLKLWMPEFLHVMVSVLRPFGAFQLY